MHKFDVKYTLDNYVEYYRFVLLKKNLIKNIIFVILFLAIGIFWLVDTGEGTQGVVLPIVSFAFSALVVLMEFITFPMVKKNLKNRQSEIDRTHIFITFDHDEVVYTNLTEVDKKSETEEVKPEEEVEPIENPIDVEENVNEKIVEDEKEKLPDNVFKLKYENFMLVKETKGLFLFYLDRNTVIIMPKTTYVGDFDVSSFKEFVRCKINNKRIKFFKEN